MSLIVDQAGWAWAAGVLAIIAAVAGYLFRGRSGRFLAAGILLPVGAAVCVALGLAGISLARQGRGGPVLIMLDFSGSTRGSPWRDPAWVRALAEKRLGAGRDVAVAAFSGQERRMLVPRATPGDAATWPARFDWEPGPISNATDIAAALEWDGKENVAGARWIVTDGLWRLPERGVPVRGPVGMTVVGGTAPDAAVRDVMVRSGGENGAVEILAQVRVVHGAGTVRAQLEVRRDGATVASPTIDLAGEDVTRWVTLPDRLADRLPHRYEVAIKIGGDPFPENDVGSVLWPGPPDAGHVLVIGQRAPSWLARVGGRFVTAEQALTDAPGMAAEGWQAVILSDVPAEAAEGSALATLPASTAKTLDTFVRQTGGGLLILGQGHAFGPGRYGEGSIAGDILEDLSPVASRPPVGGNRHIVFLLDASSSMNTAEAAVGTPVRRFTLLARAVEEATGYLGTADRVTVITFNREARLVADEHGGTAGAALIREKLSAVKAEGETAPDAALGAVATATEQSLGSQVVLITDGEIPSMDVGKWKALIERTLVSKFIVMAPAPVRSPGAGSQPTTLERLVTTLPRATWTKMDNPAGWSEVLRQMMGAEVRGTVRSSPPVVWRIADDPAAVLQTAASWTQTWQKPEAVPLALNVSDPQAPVAVVVQRGLGKVGAIAIFDDGMPGYQGLFEAMLKKVAASPGDRRFSTAVTRMPEGDWRVTADGTFEGTFLNGLSLEIAAIGEGEKLPMVQSGPGHYEARLTAPRGLSALITRAEKSPEGVTENLVARVQSPAVETSEWPATVDPLPIARLLPPGATEISGSMTDASTWDVPASGLVPLSNVFWILATALALAALWIRR